MSRKLIYVVPLVLTFGLIGVVNGVEGIFGQYYEGGPPTEPWGPPVLERLDPMVNFNWGTGSPDPSMAADGFAARWTGEVVIPNSGSYTFHTQTDDGVRLWVNDEQLEETGPVLSTDSLRRGDSVRVRVKRELDQEIDRVSRHDLLVLAAALHAQPPAAQVRVTGSVVAADGDGATPAKEEASQACPWP